MLEIGRISLAIYSLFSRLDSVLLCMNNRESKQLDGTQKNKSILPIELNTEITLCTQNYKLTNKRTNQSYETPPFRTNLLRVINVKKQSYSERSYWSVRAPGRF